MMDDLISRRDAINAVSEITTTMSVCTNKDECYGMKRMQKQAITELANLPSAEPDTTTHDSIPAKTGENDGDKTSGDCISRQAAIDIAKELTITVEGYEMHNQAVMNYCTEIMQLPSAQPERPKGKWIHQVKFSRVECDQCGKVFRNSFAPKNFCPNCGADMRGNKHEIN